MCKSSSIATQARLQSRLTLRPLMASCKISPAIAAVRAQSMCRQAQAGEPTCLAPISNWMAFQEAPPLPAMQTNSPSIVGEEGWHANRKTKALPQINADDRRLGRLPDLKNR